MSASGTERTDLLPTSVQLKHFLRDDLYSDIAQALVDTVARTWSRTYPLAFLDLGCGDGYLGDALLAALPASSGTFADISSEMLSRNKPSDRKTLVLGSSLELDDLKELPDCRFDLVLCNMLLHHCVGNTYVESRRNAEHVMRSLRRLMAPSGKVMILEQVYQGYVYHNAPAVLIFALTSLRRPSFVVEQIRHLGANMAGVGVAFASDQTWRQTFRKTGWAIEEARSISIDSHGIFRRSALLMRSSTENLYVLSAEK